MQAHLLAQPAGQQIGKTGVRQQPEQRPAAHAAVQHTGQQLGRRHKIRHQTKANHQADGNHHRLACRAPRQMRRFIRVGAQFQPRRAVALDPVFDPQHDFGVHRLRAAIAAPQPAGQRRPPEQPQRTDNQRASQIHQILRPETPGKQKNPLAFQIQPDGLVAIPAQPGRAQKNQLGEQHHGHPPGVEAPRCKLGHTGAAGGRAAQGGNSHVILRQLMNGRRVTRRLCALPDTEKPDFAEHRKPVYPARGGASTFC